MDSTLYEYTLILRQDLSSAQIEALKTQYEKAIKEAGGVLENSEYCGLLTLAYPIGGSKRAHYMLWDVKAKPGALDDMKRRLRLSQDVLRFLEVRVSSFSARPSVLSRSRGKWMESEGGGATSKLSLEKPKMTTTQAN